MLYKLTADWGSFHAGQMVTFYEQDGKWYVSAYTVGSSDFVKEVGDTEPALAEITSEDMAPYFNNLTARSLAQHSDGTVYYITRYLFTSVTMEALRLDLDTSMWSEPEQVSPFMLTPITVDSLSPDMQSHYLVAMFYGIHG